MAAPPGELVVVLGASGRIGADVSLRLASTGSRLFLVGRDQDRLAALVAQTGAQAVPFDATCDDPATLWASILTTQPCRLTIVETVLDRSSSRAMRRSIDAVTSLVHRLCDEAGTASVPARLVAATSVAALALAPYATDYGRAKRRQEARYRALPVPAALVRLPILHAPQAPVASRTDRLLWWCYDFSVRTCSYGAAAEAIATAVRAGPGPTHEVGPPTQERSLLALRGLTRRPHAFLLRCSLAVPVCVLGRVLRRADPHWQRRAAYAALTLTPHGLRSRVDHHQYQACAWPYGTGTVVTP